MIAQILTAWIGDGSDTANARRPAVADDYTLTKWTDVTGQPSENLVPDPNLYVVRVEADAAVIAAIEADPNYEVLWSE